MTELKFEMEERECSRQLESKSKNGVAGREKHLICKAKTNTQSQIQRKETKRNKIKRIKKKIK